MHALADAASALSIFKRCSCGRTYSWQEWQRLPFAGLQHTDDETGRYLTEHRHCLACRTTLAVEFVAQRES